MSETKKTMPPKMLRLAEAGRELGVSAVTVWQWIKDGTLPAYAFPRRRRRTFRVARRDVERFLARCRTGPPVNDA